MGLVRIKLYVSKNGWISDLNPMRPLFTAASEFVVLNEIEFSDSLSMSTSSSAKKYYPAVLSCGFMIHN